MGSWRCGKRCSWVEPLEEVWLELIPDPCRLLQHLLHVDSQPALQFLDLQTQDSQVLKLIVSNCIVEVHELFVYLSIYLIFTCKCATLERGLCLRVSGESPISPVNSFHLLREQCACTRQDVADWVWRAPPTS